MPAFHLFQPLLSNARYHEINRVGWGATDWDRQYSNLTSWLKPEEAAERVSAVLDADLFTHACTVEAADLEALFVFTNGYAPDAGRRIVSHMRGRSGSVGDVAVRDDGKAFACCSFGWGELLSELGDRFLALSRDLV